MKKSRHTEEKIIGILREAQGGMKVRDVCARHNISVQASHGWKRNYGGMQVDGVRQARAMGEENARLKRMVADLTVQIGILKAINAKNSEPGQQATGGMIRAAKRSGQDRADLSRRWSCTVGQLPGGEDQRGGKAAAHRIVKLSRQHRLQRAGPGQQARQEAWHRNQVWNWDFVSDQVEGGTAFRILTLIDEHTRQ